MIHRQPWSRVALAALGMWRAATENRCGTWWGKPCCPQRAGHEAVYLTYDDGPCYPRTFDLADALTAEGVNATFYALGDRLSHVAADASQVIRLRRTLDNGHLLAHHTMTHQVLSKRGGAQDDSKQLHVELHDAKRVLEDLVVRTGYPRVRGPAPWRNRHFRPPGGELSEGTLAHSYVNELFDLTALWDIDTFDWDAAAAPDVDAVMRRIDSGWKSGAAGHIILMHECKNEKATGINASVRIVRHLKAKCPKCIFPNMDHCLLLRRPDLGSVSDARGATFPMLVAGMLFALYSLL